MALVRRAAITVICAILPCCTLLAGIDGDYRSVVEADGAPDALGIEAAKTTHDASADAVVPCESGSSGPLSASFAASKAGPGVDWLDWDSARLAGGGTAKVVVRAGRASNLLIVNGFRASVPSTATLAGVTVHAIRMRGAQALAGDRTVSLAEGTELFGADRRVTGGSWPGNLTAATYGGPTDTWDASLTPEKINASSFGVAIAAEWIPTDGGDDNVGIYVDAVTVTVDYTCP